MPSDNKTGNPYHDKLGRFTGKENDAFQRSTDDNPEIKDLSTKSSGYSKNMKYDGKSWKELGENQNSFIEVNYTTPLTLKLFKDDLLRSTIAQQIFEPADFKQEWDKLGVDLVVQTSSGRQFTIDLKCTSDLLGKNIDVSKPVHRIILFKTDPNKIGQNEPEDGWIFKDNLTDFVGFTAINTPYNKEQLFNLGDARTKAKYAKAASIVIVKKQNLVNYITSNFMTRDEFYNKFKLACNDVLIDFGEPQLIPLVGKDGVKVNMVVSLDKNYRKGGFVAELQIGGSTIVNKCRGYSNGFNING